MNQSEAKKIIANLVLVQALADGKLIEYRSVDRSRSPLDWRVIEQPSFRSGEFEYRVQPKSKVEYGNFYPYATTPMGTFFNSKENANFYHDKNRPNYLVKITTVEGEKPTFEVIDR